MRVCFANHSTAPKSLGGAERSLIRLVEDWQGIDPDFEPTFVTKAPRGTFIDALEQRGWQYQAYRFRGWALPSPQPAPAAERATFATADYAAVSAIIRQFEQQRPDLVVTNTLVAPWAAFAAAALGIPQAWFIREYGDLDHGLQFQIGRDATLRDIGLMALEVVTNSQSLRAHLAPFIDPERISVAYPAVEVEQLLAGRAAVPVQVPFPQEDPGLRITMVGRVEESKGQFRVIDALGELARRGVTASVCFVGAWTHPGYDLLLRERARSLGIAGRVTFAGEQRNPAPYIHAADVCVTASTLEAFGRSTAEYMALGRAVVAADNGGSAELVVPGRTGRLFPVDDTAAFADALEHYAMHPEDVLRHGSRGQEELSRTLSTGHDNASAIARLSALVGTEGYRLPEIARYWFDLPATYASLGATSAKAAIGLLVSRVGTRSGLVGRALAAPGVAARRLVRR
ncbi:glycosyltransferase family 4 protein [Curtobacterium sp. MCBD17_028]|uniref:glycosyltransferase family 4 protein n=1 Tax=Curtobacterium sp. MCBD17_028 TaxID=2175670 RepID=UPI000DA9B544|nr:glycosyltransferase family 4 protein [Curtobacterium sp. MCBD17_028]PZE24366.1 hypothetical protein DEI86_12695 [Curtobacterium sp. MCBD17_028]